MKQGRQVVVTVASGSHAEKLDFTFTSFARNPFLELHAFILGNRLPERQMPGISYHLRPPDPSFSHPMRDLYYRRWLFIDELEADYALVVDNSDVLCLQVLPELPVLLRGAALAGCVEHQGGQYLAGQQYVSCYLNAGVTFWDVAASRDIREAVVRRGKTRFRSVEDQLVLNEVVQTCYFDRMIILPTQYNFRAHLPPVRVRGWPTVDRLDGVMIYHNSHCTETAKQMVPVRAKADLPPLVPDERPLTPFARFWRRVQHRLGGPPRLG